MREVREVPKVPKVRKVRKVREVREVREVRGAGADDAEALHALAAETFPLACPPETSATSIAAFIAANLSVDAFTRYLSDPRRQLFVCEGGESDSDWAGRTGGGPETGDSREPGREAGAAFEADGAPPSGRPAEIETVLAGYTMVVFGEPSDPDVAASVFHRPTAELSKLYVRESRHGAGIAPALVEAAVQAARARGAISLWLGVNQRNARANRFYEKQGFALVGTKKFLVGERYEDDFVRERLF